MPPASEGGRYKYRSRHLQGKQDVPRGSGLALRRSGQAFISPDEASQRRASQGRRETFYAGVELGVSPVARGAWPDLP